MTPAALIFDLDGVLVDTVKLHYKAWQQVASTYNRPFDQAMNNRFRGRHREDCVRELFASHDLTEDDIRSILELKNTHYSHLLETIHPDVLVIPGVSELLQTARDAGFRIGVASSSVNAKAVLKHTSLDHWFDAVADGSTCLRHKPHPDPFIWVAGALKVCPENCIVFEDGVVGIQAARTAGMAVVGIGTVDAMDAVNHHYDHIGDIDLISLLEQINRPIDAIKE